MDRTHQLAIVNKLLNSENYRSLSDLVNHLRSLLFRNLQNSDSIFSDIIDYELLEEIRVIMSQRDILLYFGKSLREIKCVLPEDNGMREHIIMVQYRGPKKLWITKVLLPHSALEDREYKCLTDIITGFEHYINSLSHYFYELDRIDRFCSVIEPVQPTYRESYRRILLDERTWLHVDVTHQGFAKNAHVIGQQGQWHDKIQAVLLDWNHDRDIVENITAVFDMMNFPLEATETESRTSRPKQNSPTRQNSPTELKNFPTQQTNSPTQQNLPSPFKQTTHLSTEEPTKQELFCQICLSSGLPDGPGVPQPLCQNAECIGYFHRDCLYQWLVSSSGGRPPAFRIAVGSCPVCQQLTSCSKMDDSSVL